MLGCGPVEPFLLAALLKSHERTSRYVLSAVDVDAQVTRHLLTLRDGGSVDVKQLARVCRDGIDDAASPDNLNFTEALAACIRECIDRGLVPPFQQEEDRLRLVGTIGTRIQVYCQDAREFVQGQTGRFDLAYLGLLLTNLRKGPEADSTVALLRELRDAMSTTSIVGIGGSLSPQHGVHLDLHDLAEAGYDTLYLSLENLLVHSGSLYGDYGIGAIAPGSRLRSKYTPASANSTSWRTFSDKYGVELLLGGGLSVGGKFRLDCCWRIT
jgi:hypothetical protein